MPIYLQWIGCHAAWCALMCCMERKMNHHWPIRNTSLANNWHQFVANYLFHFVQSDHIQNMTAMGAECLVACATNFPLTLAPHTSKQKLRSTERIEFVQHTFSAWHFVLHWQLSMWQLVVEALCMQAYTYCALSHSFWKRLLECFFSLRNECQIAIPHIHVSMDYFKVLCSLSTIFQAHFMNESMDEWISVGVT